MSSFYSLDSNGNAEVLAGATISAAIWEAQRIVVDNISFNHLVATEEEEIRRALEARGVNPDDYLYSKQPEIVTFTFNGVVVKVSVDSQPELLLRDWHRAVSGYIEKSVGPQSKTQLSAEELANDARIAAENEARWTREQKARDAKARAHRERVEARMVGAPEMEFADEEGAALWQSWVDANTDPLGSGVMAYAKRWARMMQLEMSEGKPLEKIYETTSNEADLEGMSGASGSFAEQMLIQAWKHGAELKRVRDEHRRAIRARFS